MLFTGSSIEEEFNNIVVTQFNGMQGVNKLVKWWKPTATEKKNVKALQRHQVEDRTEVQRVCKSKGWLVKVWWGESRKWCPEGDINRSDRWVDKEN